MITLVAGIFGVSVGFFITVATSSHSFMDWQVWAAMLPVLISGVVYYAMIKK